MLKSFYSASARAFTNIRMHSGKTLKEVVTELEVFAPLSAAEKWDNVGLLVEPTAKRPIRNIMLTNDLTEPVLDEACAEQCDMIISYHPPIFAPLKRLTQSNWKERIISKCLSEGIAVYSPHTAWDSVLNGVNDWLAAALDPIDIKPITPNLLLPEGSGAGRVFKTEVTISQAIIRLQKLLAVDVHVAFGVNHNLQTDIRTVAVCAGSGGSLLKGVSADLYITGEMSHHDLLEANHCNTSVILSNHSNSERGYMRDIIQIKLNDWLQKECKIIISRKDVDPLQTYATQ